MTIRCQRCGAQLEAAAKFCGVCGATLADPNVGRMIAGRYTLQERIGSGSLGIVYRAEQLSLGRRVAIKLLGAGADPATAERFRREGQVLCKLRSAHTVTTYEFDREPDGTLYIAMELSAGRNLAEVFRSEGQLAWPRVLRILSGLCDALAEAHALGVVHRDLKPENILLEPRPANRDFVKVLDFGLARVLPEDSRLSPPGQTVGAVEFSSPEQLLRAPLDARSDLYALGVLGYLLTTGRHPFHDARTFGDMVAAQIHRVPAPASSLFPDVPADVDTIFARLLEKNAVRRFPDAPTLAHMINLVLVAPAPDGGDTIRESPGEEETVLAPVPKK